MTSDDINLPPENREPDERDLDDTDLRAEAERVFRERIEHLSTRAGVRLAKIGPITITQSSRCKYIVRAQIDWLFEGQIVPSTEMIWLGVDGVKGGYGRTHD